MSLIHLSGLLCGRGGERYVFLRRSLGGWKTSLQFVSSSIPLVFPQKIILLWTFLFGLGALVPSREFCCHLPNRKATNMAALFSLLDGYSFWRGRNNVRFWSPSPYDAGYRACFSFVVWLILLTWGCWSFLFFGGFRVLGRLGSWLGRFFMVVLTHWTDSWGRCHCWSILFVVFCVGRGGRFGPYSLALWLCESCLGFFLLDVWVVMLGTEMLEIWSRSSSSIGLLEKKAVFLWCAEMCYFMGFMEECNSRVFRGLERDPLDVWALARFHVSLLALILKIFCNYFIGMILHS